MTRAVPPGVGDGLPSIENFLAPQYATAALAPAGSNTTFYSSPAFDAALAAGTAHPPSRPPVRPTRGRERSGADLPAAPLFSGLDQAVWDTWVSGCATTSSAKSCSPMSSSTARRCDPLIRFVIRRLLLTIPILIGARC